MPNNALFVIKPYKWEGTWVFDDPSVGLAREPFVAGIPEIIERATAHLPSPEQGFTVVFSATQFPGAQLTLDLVREEYDGNVYRWRETGMEGWLCPALFRYFEAAPETIFLQLAPGGANL